MLNSKRKRKVSCPPFVLLLQMIFPWMFDEIHALRPFKDAAHILADKEDWPPLYDIAALKNNKVASNVKKIELVFLRYYIFTDVDITITSIRITLRPSCCKKFNIFSRFTTGSGGSCSVLRRYVCELQTGHGHSFPNSRNKVMGY